MKPLPIVSAFLVCDDASRDAMTGKVSLYGIFKTIFTAQVPTAHPSLVLYASLTEAQGEYELWVEFVHVPMNRRIARFPSPEEGALRIKADSRLDYIEVVFKVHWLPFPELGEYEFRLFVDGRPSALRRVWVLSSPETFKKEVPEQ
jgi:uncharacterized protein YbdZ (MbtH family)